MAAQTVEEWADSRIQTFPLSTLSGAAIGIDASYYLHLRMNRHIKESAKGSETNKHSHNIRKTSTEPLFNAVNGFPYVLKKTLEDDIKALKKHDVSAIFVFNGLDYVNREPASSRSGANLRVYEDAWNYYASKSENAADLTSKTFGRADYDVDVLYRYLQQILFELQVPYMVAPYSALAQLSYMVKLQAQYIDAVMAPTDCFLFNVDKVILGFDKELANFSWLSKTACQESLDRCSDSVFRDAQLLSGCSFLPAFPVSARGPTNKITVREALTLINSAGRSVPQLCQQFREDPLVQNLQYLDRYKKAVMTIRHHVVLEENGVVSPLDLEHAPGDVHEFVGQRLPEELFFYISKGMIGARIPSWLASGEISFTLPAGIFDAEPYRRLVVEQLNPVRATTLRLLADSLHRYYHMRVVKVKAWFEKDTTDLTITMKEVPAFSAQLATWKIHEGNFPELIKQSKPENDILATLKALQDEAMPHKTTKPDPTPLKTVSEIYYNVMWRFLQVRGYVNEKHELTAWGKALTAALESLDPSDDAEECILLGIEMLRLGLFDGHELTGAAVPTQDQKTSMTNLVSRVACLGRLKHKQIGYSGPLDRQLSTFAWMITAVRVALRDLIETVLVGMCLNGNVDRDRKDWSELALGLPFVAENGCGLGIALKTCLDTFHLYEKENDHDLIKTKIRGQKENTMMKVHGVEEEKNFKFFKNASNFPKNLDLSYRLWDAIYAGSQAAPKEFKDAKLFTEANEWLAVRK